MSFSLLMFMMSTWSAAYILYSYAKRRKKLASARSLGVLPPLSCTDARIAGNGGKTVEAQQALNPELARQIDMAAMRAILASDPAIARIALQKSGMDGARPDQILENWEELLRAVRLIPELVFQVLHIAATQTDVNVECGQLREKIPSLFPSSELEIGMYRDPSQIGNILLEDLMLDDESFFARLATGEIRTIDYYERLMRHRVMYLLVDVSGSMKETITDRPYPRHIWARGVAIKQLIKALNGEASYFLRYFTDSPGRLWPAKNRVEAQAIIDNLFEVDFSEGGTNIQLALQTAAHDIKEYEKDCAQAEILLLSDGESSLDVKKLEEEFCGKVRLHTVLIGNTDSASLREISTTYLKL